MFGLAEQPLAFQGEGNVKEAVDEVFVELLRGDVRPGLNRTYGAKTMLPTGLISQYLPHISIGSHFPAINQHKIGGNGQ